MSGEAPSCELPLRFESPSGMRVELNSNGAIRRLDHADIIINLFLGSEIEGGPANIYLRRFDDSIESSPLIGPRSPGTIHFGAQGPSVSGLWKEIRFNVSLVLAQSAPAWFWHVTLENTGTASATVDLIYAQEVALADYGAVRMNEYYVSQYIDHTPLEHPTRGTVLAIRQNLSMGGRQPWAAIGSLCKGASFATDALQLHGLATRAGSTPQALGAKMLPGRRQQHEHSMAVIQDAPVELLPGAAVQRGFFGWFEPDHQAATSATDLAFVDKALALPEAAPGNGAAAVSTAAPATATLFTARPILATLDLTDAEIADLFGKARRGIEQENGTVLSFFTGVDRHVVLKAKELKVLRPHGHVMRTGADLTPDEASLTSTTWMCGVFHSLVTQGHVSINRVLSTTRSYLSLLRAHGQRIFVELDDEYYLLDVPSAYEITPNGCRWLYKHASGIIEVRSWAPVSRHELNLTVDVRAGAACRFLVSNHIAINGDDGAAAVPVLFESDGEGVTIRAVADSDVGRRFPDGYFRVAAHRGTVVERVGDDELLFSDGQSRRQPFLVMVTAPATSIGLRITGHLIPGAPLSAKQGKWVPDQRNAGKFWSGLTGELKLHPRRGSGCSADVANVQAIVPWLAHNAMIHYLAPRGLEQFSGGGWGTRDVSQGPVELLLAIARWEPLHDLLQRVFRTQNPNGDWPQWFMFFERERGIRPGDSHGDIVFWPLLALAEYLLASEDASLLDERLPFFDERGDEHAEKATVWGHVERALQVITARVIAGTSLAAYGHGDWDDSLQPADPSMRERLCSSWTVTLQYQTVTALAAALRRVGRATDAARLDAVGARVRQDFQRLLIADETLTGFAYFHPDARIDYMLHPRDQTTGIRYRLLPMVHAIINDMLTPEQAKTHVAYIRQHILGCDGARLFDRPLRYRGGVQRYFQRAETSTYFGREIGVMYMHAHLRYAEAMARYGDADAFFLALRQANPVGIRSVVPTANSRQANCYYSSSDAAFADRYEALERYDEVKHGTVALDGGWRVYSSGAGIAVRLIYQTFLGLRQGKSRLVIDPMIPKALDGLRADVDLAGAKLAIAYRVTTAGHGPTALTLNGTGLPFEREPNPYRAGGATVAMAAITPLLTRDRNVLQVQLG